MNKNQRISMMILAEYTRTGNIREAIIAVCGKDAYDQLINEVYHGLRAKSEAAGRKLVPAS
jgi:hypothetical protein